MTVQRVRIALLALAVSGDQQLAVFIGTRVTPAGDDEPEWLTGFARRQDLLDYLSGEPDTPDVATIFDLPPPADLLQPWYDAAQIGLSDGNGDDMEDRFAAVDGSPSRSSWWIDRVVEVRFFGRGTRFERGGGIPLPLARFATAGEVIDDAAPGTAAPPKWTVSRLRLDRETAWPTSADEVGAAPTLTGFRFVGHVPLAINVHDHDPSLEGKAKRYDTRALLFAHAVKSWQSGRLWFDEADRSARFRLLNLGFSETARDGIEITGAIQPSRAGTDRGLDGLTGRGAPFLQRTTAESDAPLFAGLPAFAGRAPTLAAPTREIGLRRIGPRFVLRAELAFAVKDPMQWTTLWRAFAGPITDLAEPRLSKVGNTFRLAIEQLAETVDAEGLEVPVGTAWLLTARFDPAPGDTSFDSAVLAVVAEAHADAFQPLRRLRPETGMSLIPALVPRARDPLSWHVVGRLTTAHVRRHIRTQGQPSWSWARDGEHRADLRSLEPRLTKDLWQLPVHLGREMHCTLPQVTRTDGKPPTLAGSVTMRATDVEAETLQPRPGEGLRFELVGAMPGGAQQLRIGALETDIVGGQGAGPAFVQRVTLHRGARPLDRDPPLPHRIETILRAAAVVPAEQDALADEPAALILPLGDASVDAVGLRLVAVEQFGNGHDQEATWDLWGKQGAPHAGKLLVIESAPFRIAAVEPLRAVVDDSDSHIATYRRRDDGKSAWTFVDPEEVVRILLPPQIIGEALERVPSWKGVVGDIAPNEPVDVRLGSLTRVDLDPTFRTSRTHEVGWNLRRLLSRSSDAAPGAQIREVRFEIAYGLLARFRPTRATWLSEMDGVIGRPPRRLESADVTNRDHANAIVARQAKRLAVEKIWSGRPEDTFEATDGLTFTLRGASDSAGGGTDTTFRFPLASGYPPAGASDPGSDLVRRYFEDPAAAPNPSGQRSFAGGIAWGFQSANIMREVYAVPVSREGRITGVHLSALGGWGQQRAQFAYGKSIVETETTMGRTALYKLERIGRIGALGHRAKHVIVYRRTVAPSAQFFNVAPIGWQQDEHAGRPILRKVEEYVDILQPERRYPESGVASPEPGCLNGARFVSRRILVDSDWGADVRNEGWMVPLWRRDLAAASAADPDSPANIYPKPLVQLLMPGEDGNEVAIEIDTPEKLVFYTSALASESADNVDSWHAVEGIDFCDAPAPSVAEHRYEGVGSWSFPPLSDVLHDGMLPPAPRHAGGHERLTIGLVDMKSPVKIAARRVDDSPAVVLKNVSLSRARPLGSAAGSDPPGRRAGDVAGALANDIRGQLDRLLGEIPARFEALGREALAGGVLGGRERARHAIEESRAALKDKIEAIYDQAAAAVGDLQAQVDALQLPVGKLTEKAMDEVRGALEAERARLVGQAEKLSRFCLTPLLEEARGLVAAQVAGFDDLVADLAGMKEGEAFGDVRGRLKRALDDAGAKLARITHTLADDAKEDLTAGFQQLRAAPAAIDRVTDVAPDLEALRAKIAVAIAELKLRSAAARGEIDAELDVDVGAARAAFDRYLAHALFTMEEARARLTTLATNPGVPKAARAPIGAATTGLGAVRSLLGEIASLDWQLPMDTLKTEIDRHFDRIDADATAAETSMAGALVAIAAEVKTGVRDAFDSALREARLGAWEARLNAGIEALAGPAGLGGVINTTNSAAQDLLDATAAAADAAVVASAHATAGMLQARVRPSLDAFAAGVEALIDEIARSVRSPLLENSAIKAGIDDVVKAVGDFLNDVVPAVDAGAMADRVKRQIVDVDASAGDLGAAAGKLIDELADRLLRIVDAVDDEVQAVRNAIEAEIAKQARAITDRVDGFLSGVQDGLARHLGVRPGDLVDGVERAADQARYLYQEGDNVLRLIRAVGDPPKTDTLGLNRPEVAYALDVAKSVVDLTPAVALANRVADTAAAAQNAARAAGQLLESFGVRLPVTGLGADLVPDSLKNLSLAKLLPNMGGLDLEGLFRRAKFPDLSGKDGQGVKLTRGFDKERREAWLKAEIDVTLAKSEAILDFGPVALMLDGGSFRAETRTRVGANGRAETEAKGQIAGDWRLVTGGMDIITFEQTPLLFDKSGKIDFKISSDRVRLAPSLEFLTNLLAKAGKSIPAGVEPVMRDGVPAGLMSRLQMELPPIATGAFAVTDLSLGASFAVLARPQFEIAVALNIASRDAPFTLAVWLLNGGGYIAQSLTYQPTARPQPLLTYTLDVAIVAGVGIGFGFGVVSGGVWLQIGCSVALSWSTGGGGNVTTVTAFLLARGNVDVAGLVTASIMLRLELSYDGSQMLARGTLRLSFRISVFYTLRVNQGVEYHLAGERRAESAPINYADSFG